MRKTQKQRNTPALSAELKKVHDSISQVQPALKENSDLCLPLIDAQPMHHNSNIEELIQNLSVATDINKDLFSL